MNAIRFYPNSPTGFVYLPTWTPPPPSKLLYQEAEQALAENQHETAQGLYRQVVARYPESEEARMSLTKLFYVETIHGHNFNGFRNYLIHNPNCHYDAEISARAEQLITQTYVAEGDYQSALARLEAVAMNPACLADSVFAVIDAGFVHLEAEAHGVTLTGARPDLCPANWHAQWQHQDELLTLLIDPEATAASITDGEQAEGATLASPESPQFWEYRLEQSRPNPFSQLTAISYQLSAFSAVSLRIYNTAGQLVRTLVNESKAAGSQEVMWDGQAESGEQAATGVYFYRLESGNYHATKRMILMR